MRGFNPVSPAVQLRRRPIDEIFDSTSPNLHERDHHSAKKLHIPSHPNHHSHHTGAHQTGANYIESSPSIRSQISQKSDIFSHAASHASHVPSRVSIVKKEFYSDVVAGLTASQGSLSLVTALLAGFAFAGLSSVSVEEYERAPDWVAYLYPIVATSTIASSLYTSICCAVLEQ